MFVSTLNETYCVQLSAVSLPYWIVVVEWTCSHVLVNNMGDVWLCLTHLQDKHCSNVLFFCHLLSPLFALTRFLILRPLEGGTDTHFSCFALPVIPFRQGFIYRSWSPFADLKMDFLPESLSEWLQEYRTQETHSSRKPSRSFSVNFSVKNNAHQMFLLSVGKASDLSFVDVSFTESFDRGPQTFALISDILHNSTCA